MTRERPIEYPASLSIGKRPAYCKMVLQLRAELGKILSDQHGSDEPERLPRGAGVP